MPGKKRKGSSKGGPESRKARVGGRRGMPPFFDQNKTNIGTASGVRGGSPGFVHKTTKRAKIKDKSKGVKDIAQRRKKK